MTHSKCHLHSGSGKYVENYLFLSSKSHLIIAELKESNYMFIRKSQ